MTSVWRDVSKSKKKPTKRGGKKMTTKEMASLTLNALNERVAQLESLEKLARQVDAELAQRINALRDGLHRAASEEHNVEHRPIAATTRGVEVCPYCPFGNIGLTVKCSHCGRCDNEKKATECEATFFLNYVNTHIGSCQVELATVPGAQEGLRMNLMSSHPFVELFRSGVRGTKYRVTMEEER